MVLSQFLIVLKQLQFEIHNQMMSQVLGEEHGLYQEVRLEENFVICCEDITTGNKVENEITYTHWSN